VDAGSAGHSEGSPIVPGREVTETRPGSFGTAFGFKSLARCHHFVSSDQLRRKGIGEAMAGSIPARRDAADECSKQPLMDRGKPGTFPQHPGSDA
jgi:hypothetical protein